MPKMTGGRFIAEFLEKSGVDAVFLCTNHIKQTIG